jgi:hypothetical protein
MTTCPRHVCHVPVLVPPSDTPALHPCNSRRTSAQAPLSPSRPHLRHTGRCPSSGTSPPSFPRSGRLAAGLRKSPDRADPQPDRCRSRLFPARPARDLRYSLAVLDRYGRVADRATLRALAWGPGQALALTLTAGSVLAVAGPDASVRVGNDGYLRLPVGVRRACHLAAGDRVLLVAEPSAGRLLLHPPAALTALPAARHAAIAEGATP